MHGGKNWWSRGQIVAKILIAEDEDSVRNLVTRALELHDHEVKAVIGGSAAPLGP